MRKKLKVFNQNTTDVLTKKFEETWQLKPDDTIHILCLTVDEDLPVEIKDKLEKLLLATEPEDSV
ncbi:hypothetical protein [Sediminibacterium sp.]|uniref:hypothetical protein n=1 Tax=Sediminibacterium sp. TaxID=1917865 RepID=UPI00272F2A16|nr:hypothetical protein [Sediminibacterium sp.]MDP2421425.1 hypothetical protein [Sediminibacterium sp.]